MSTPHAVETFQLLLGGQELGPYSHHDLQMLASHRQLAVDARLRRMSDDATFTAADIPWIFSDRSWVVALALSLFLGTLGIDRFYLGHTKLGVAKLLTAGGLGLWWLVDVLLIGLRLVSDVDGRALRHPASVSTASAHRQRPGSQ